MKNLFIFLKTQKYSHFIDWLLDTYANCAQLWQRDLGLFSSYKAVKHSTWATGIYVAEHSLFLECFMLTGFISISWSSISLPGWTMHDATYLLIIIFSYQLFPMWKDDYINSFMFNSHWFSSKVKFNSFLCEIKL